MNLSSRRGGGVINLTDYEQFLNLGWEGRGSDSYPIISQPPPGRRIINQSTNLSHNFCYLIFILFQISFRLRGIVFPWYLLHMFNFFTHIAVIYLICAYSVAVVFRFPLKMFVHAHQKSKSNALIIVKQLITMVNYIIHRQWTKVWFQSFNKQ